MESVVNHGKNYAGQGVLRIEAERIRQIDEEGFSSTHDDKHGRGELAIAAACYAANASNLRIVTPREFANGVAYEDPWPWDIRWDGRPYPDHGNVVGFTEDQQLRLRMLVKAGALIAAEIDRLMRIGS